MLAASYRVGKDLSRSRCEADETTAIVSGWKLSEIPKYDGVENVATLGENCTSDILEEATKASKGSLAALHSSTNSSHCHARSSVKIINEAVFVTAVRDSFEPLEFDPETHVCISDQLFEIRS